MGGGGIEPANPIPIKISSQNQLYKNQVKNYFFNLVKRDPHSSLKIFFWGRGGIEPANPIPIQISSQNKLYKNQVKN